eukprot:2441969-Pleurochrysis_carterae.AAC.2
MYESTDHVLSLRWADDGLLYSVRLYIYGPQLILWISRKLQTRSWVASINVSTSGMFLAHTDARGSRHGRASGRPAMAEESREGLTTQAPDCADSCPPYP